MKEANLSSVENSAFPTTKRTEQGIALKWVRSGRIEVNETILRSLVGNCALWQQRWRLAVARQKWNCDSFEPTKLPASFGNR